jgi:hypothetical protein
MTTASDYKRAVAVFPTCRAAEQAVYALEASGFPMQRVSVVAQNAVAQDAPPTAPFSTVQTVQSVTEHGVGNRAGQGGKLGLLSGGLLGALTGLLVGLGALAIPGVGPVMLAGAAATALATTATGTGIGAVAGGLLGALIGLGIPEEQARTYHNQVLAGQYLLMIDGTKADLTQVEALLRHHSLRSWEIYPLAESSLAAQPSPTLPASAPADAFQPQTVHIEVFEEVPQIRRQVVVREEVKVRKQIERQTLDEAATVRREQLEIGTQGSPVVKTVEQNSRAIER